MLAYLSLQEAEIALGRELTRAEKIWFNYSANKPDYILHLHGILIVIFLYTLLPLPYLLIELSQSEKLDKYKIQPKVKHSFQDMWQCYKDVMRYFFFVGIPVLLTSYPSIKRLGIRTSLPLPSLSEILLQFFVYILVEDYSHYWIHRMLHSKWGYEKIHHVHHRFTAPMGLVASYAHWSEILILGIPTFLGPALVPGHFITYWLWFILNQMLSIEIHSGYDFSWSLTNLIPFYGGAEYHDFHHFVGGQSHSNYASVFTYCDYIYGTDKGYRYHAMMKKMKGKSESNGQQRMPTQDIKANQFN